MTVGSGVGGFASFAAESTYGTFVTPTRHIEVESATLKKAKKTVQGGGLAAGTLVERGARRVVTSSEINGQVKAEVTSKGFGLLFAHALGSAATPVQQAATAAYLQSHSLGDNLGKSLSVQLGIPDLGGVIRPYSYAGNKIQSMQLDCAVDQLLMATFDFDGQNVSEAPAAVTPSFSNVDPFHFGQMTVKIGTYGAEAAVQGVRSVSVKLDRPMKQDRYYANNGGLKSEPILNAKTPISGTINADFVNKADFADRFSADSSFSLVWQFTGPLIASTYYEQLTVTLPQCFLDTDAPTLAGVDVVNTGYNFVAKYDGTNPAIKVDYMSTDTTV